MEKKKIINKKNVLIILLVLIFFIAFFNINYVQLYRKGSLKFISEATAGNFENSTQENVCISMSYVKEIKGEKEFNELIKFFLTPTNKNLLTQHCAIQYIMENKKIEYLNELKILQKHAEYINQLNPDSTWTTCIRSNYYKKHAFNGYYIDFLNGAIKKLENE